MMSLNIRNFPEGLFILISGAILSLKFRSIALIVLHICILAFWYLRDVKRYFARNNQVYLSPVDGIVTDINQSCFLDGYKGIEWQKISVQTRFFDSHMLYAPISGEVIDSNLSRDVNKVDIFQFLKEKVGIKTDRSFKVSVSWNNVFRISIVDIKNNNICIIEHSLNHFKGLSIIESNLVEQGGKIGIGHFGALNVVTDIYIPRANSKISVMVGQTMVGSETALGCFHQTPIIESEPNWKPKTIVSEEKSQLDVGLMTSSGDL